MLPKVFSTVFIVLMCTAICSMANEYQQSNSSYGTSPGLRSMMRIYDECQRSDGGVTMCLKKKAVTFIDRISKIDVINVGDGVKVVGMDVAADKTAKSFNENDLDQMRSLEDRDSFLNEMLAEKLANYISGRKIQISLPQVTPNELGRGLEEGRGKMKKMMSMMMMGFAMKMAAMVPIAIAGLYLLAGKALIVSKIALLLAGIIGLKKLIASKSSGGGGGTGWSSGGGSTGWQSQGGGNGGWERAYNENAQKLAYKAYAYKTE